MLLSSSTKVWFFEAIAVRLDHCPLDFDEAAPLVSARET
jgi:hypothetical protein